MEITIKIQAPELAHALETLAIAIGCTVDKIGVGDAIKEAVQQAPVVTQQIQQQPLQQASAQALPSQNIPVQQTPTQQMPTQQPAAPVQQAPVQQMPINQAPVQQLVPTQAQTYTMDQLAIAATQLMDAGKRNELIGLLAQFGVQALTALPKEQYGAFATALRGMGAKI